MKKYVVEETGVVHAHLPLPQLGRRAPSGGWILPSFDDRIINDVREGFSFEAVLAAVKRAAAYGFLTADEARFLGRRDEVAA